MQRKRVQAVLAAVIVLVLTPGGHDRLVGEDPERYSGELEAFSCSVGPR